MLTLFIIHAFVHFIYELCKYIYYLVDVCILNIRHAHNWLDATKSVFRQAFKTNNPVYLHEVPLRVGSLKPIIIYNVVLCPHHPFLYSPIITWSLTKVKNVQSHSFAD